MKIGIQFFVLFFVATYLPIYAMDGEKILPKSCFDWDEENIAKSSRCLQSWERPLVTERINDKNIGCFVTECYCAIVFRAESSQEITREFAIFSGDIFAQALNNETTREYAQNGLIDLIKRGYGDAVVAIALSRAEKYEDSSTLLAVVAIENALLQKTRRLVVDTEDLTTTLSSLDLESPCGIDTALTPSHLMSDLQRCIKQVKNDNEQAIRDGLLLIKRLFPTRSDCAVTEYLGNDSAEERLIASLMILLLAKDQRKHVVVPAGTLDYFSTKNKMNIQNALKKASSGLNGGSCYR